MMSTQLSKEVRDKNSYSYEIWIFCLVISCTIFLILLRFLMLSMNRWFDPKIEWRWLETVKIRQNYNTNSDNDNMIKELLNWIKVGLFGGFWENECFIEFDKDELRDQKLKKLGI